MFLYQHLEAGNSKYKSESCGCGFYLNKFIVSPLQKKDRFYVYVYVHISYLLDGAPW